MERLSVKSRILRSVGYDDSKKILEIEFSSGYVYQYSGVPQKIYTDLMHSDEIGKYEGGNEHPPGQVQMADGRPSLFYCIAANKPVGETGH